MPRHAPLVLASCALSALAPLAAAQDPELAWLGERSDEIAAQLGEDWTWIDEIALGMSLDLIGEATEARNTPDRINKVRVRSFQFHLGSPIADVGHAYAVADLSDGGDGTDIFLREAVAWLDTLPADLRLRVGQYYADLGQWNRTYANEFPAPHLDGVRRDFFGGNLAATGAELHQTIDTGGDRLRWSLGLATDTRGHDVDLNGNGIDPRPDGLRAFGRTGPDNWAGTARVEYGCPIGSGDDAKLCFGASAYYSPGEITFTFVNPDGFVGTADDRTDRDELRRAILGADVSFVQQLDGDMFHAATAEIWHHNGQHRRGTGQLETDGDTGVWGMYELGFSESISVGALLSYWERTAVDRNDAASYHALFGTYHVSNRNKARAFFGHTNPGFGIEKYFTVGLQWVFELGAPRPNGHQASAN